MLWSLGHQVKHNLPQHNLPQIASCQLSAAINPLLTADFEQDYQVFRTRFCRALAWDERHRPRTLAGEQDCIQIE